KSFSDPQSARCRGPGPIPWTEFNRPQPLHIPRMKKLVGASGESAVVRRSIGKDTRFYDLRGEEGFHTIAGTIVSCEVKKERVTIKLRRAPHSNFGTHNFFEVPHESGPTASLVATRVNDDVVRLSIDVEIIDSPIGTNFCWIVDQGFVVRVFPIALVGSLGAAIDNSPIRRWFDVQFHRIRLVAADIHKDLTACVVRMSRIQLRECSGQVIAG